MGEFQSYRPVFGNRIVGMLGSLGLAEGWGLLGVTGGLGVAGGDGGGLDGGVGAADMTSCNVTEAGGDMPLVA